jgi:hypothetical protein
MKVPMTSRNISESYMYNEQTNDVVAKTARHIPGGRSDISTQIVHVYTATTENFLELL